jgi:hypothetical protein
MIDLRKTCTVRLRRRDFLDRRDDDSWDRSPAHRLRNLICLGCRAEAGRAPDLVGSAHFDRGD